MLRRVHGGAVPAGALTLVEPGLGERDRRPHRGEGPDRRGRARPAARRRRQRDPRRRQHHRRAGRACSPATCGSTSSPTPCRSPPGWPGSRGVTLHLLGGRVRGTTQTAVGDATPCAALADLRVDVAFLGTNGISADARLHAPPTRPRPPTKRAMVARGQRVVVLADSSKLGREHLVRFAAARGRRRPGHRRRRRPPADRRRRSTRGASRSWSHDRHR